MSTIRVGSSGDCEIRFDVISPKDSVWAIICPEENNMLVLHRKVNSVQCFVNNNEVADKYWIRYGDVIIINGFRLDWRLITQLLNGYPVVQGNRVIPTPCVYGPPIPTYRKKHSIPSNRSAKFVTKVRWKGVSIIIAVLGAIIGVAGIILMKTNPVVYGPRLLDEKSINQPLLYGPSLLNQEEQEKIRQMQKQIKESLDSLAEQHTTPSQGDK